MTHTLIPPKHEVADKTLLRPNWLLESPRSTTALWLDKNENSDPVLLQLNQSLLKEVDPKALYTYPDLGSKYKALALFEGVEAEQLLFTPGSDGGIRAVFEAYVNVGDKVMFTSPTFAMYSVYAKIYGATPLPLEYSPSDSGPVLSTKTILDTVARERPRLLCLPNPDSPTGTVLPESDLRNMLEICSDTKTLVILDEAYYPFYPYTAIRWTREFKNLVVLRTFSKAWGLAGLRLGFAVSDPEVNHLLHKVRPMYEVNTLALAILEKVLHHRPEMEASVKRLQEGKVYFLEQMRTMGFRVLDGHGNFMHVAFGPWETRTHNALEGYVLYRRSFSDPCLRGFSRFSAAPVQQLSSVVAMIQKIKDES